ncbi:type IVB secretion system protein IcmH/DotU [Massilia sp. NR 4-1]|uniref:type IVB secretion system protein IcmH/DotU n=1 Tax=Massilia sp. NR 4-1 TaxID=1678028 RepID=UPI00067E5D5A|nr:type IVB secretion system protein IcmH/DotU [Massilia sp. NR 4-1]AKU20174.1 type VI secretion system protein ImpK [Massilia sp. NR 4-1]
MTHHIERRAAPGNAGTRGPALADLMHEGFYMLFMLKTGSLPPGDEELSIRVANFLDDFEKEARKLNANGDDIAAARYAYCAALDEIILASGFDIRSAWERKPLQLTMFGDHLAGEHFFDRLEELRSKGGARLQALQVFHQCLLLGFQGKYALEGSDKLAWLTARLGDEIAHIKGRRAAFAPRAERPDDVVHKLRTEFPVWVFSMIFALAGLAIYLGLDTALEGATLASTEAYANLVRLAPRPASLTITLP